MARSTPRTDALQNTRGSHRFVFKAKNLSYPRGQNPLAPLQHQHQLLRGDSPGDRQHYDLDLAGRLDTFADKVSNYALPTSLIKRLALF